MIKADSSGLEFLSLKNFSWGGLKFFPLVPILEKTNSRRQITVERDGRNEVSRNRTVRAFLRPVFAQLDQPARRRGGFCAFRERISVAGDPFLPTTEN
jgi:hypothetical protein